ncbi:hypothetical protein NEOLEDRAFT_1116236 [Neolentinus lepideus HHB14362 ss-1]|uniref:Virilizer N-terminal domain-containing protein n=1 Tax=Neolentinus lepideus HHB14362 ss-1 TaxID=1314782 RepID=A0A165S1T4_9AGAM|nr:hypothetical protein NEOLEDRAFT_1116236 [Neolentinus lepideus HHB14362 ss-1]
MPLLLWTTLEHAASTDLAAIRFAAAVRVRSIRIFPSNAKPFAASSDIIARTVPEAFFLNVFLNAQPTTKDANKRPAASNALVPTTIAYPGGQVDFELDMGLEFATRLMILKGNFTSISLAIYGDLAFEPPPPTYPDPKELPSIEPTPLPSSLDPSNCIDPTLLANQLLTLIDDAPPLSLLIRLMFCLKPSNDDWENPDFPYLYADLDYAADAENFDLQEAYTVTGRPLPDDVSEESISRFVAKVVNCIGPKSDDQTYFLAGVLSRAASQHPTLARCLLEKLDLEPLIDASHLDSSTLHRLLTASTNPLIAHHLHAPWFLSLLSTVLSNLAVDAPTKSTARKLQSRIRGWPVLEDALSNTQADFSAATQLLRDIGSDEQSFGVWLACLVTHADLKTKLAENSLMPFALAHPPNLLRSEGAAAGASHDEFIAFLRAYLGVACVLAVFAWSDSLGSKMCRERTLAVIRLWQEVDGYREIVNHLLLLRQMIFRLECNLDNDPPTRSGISTENIIVSLARSTPVSMLSPDMIKCSLNIRQPLSSITEDERITLRRLAITAEDGVPAAVEVLATRYENPMKMQDLRSIRVSLEIVDREMRADEWAVLNALWGEGRHGLVQILADAFSAVRRDVTGYFAAARPPPRQGEGILAELFETARDVLRLVVRLAPAYPLPGRQTGRLVGAVADVFVCTDAADMLYAQTSPACVAAQSSRQACIDAVRVLCRADSALVVLGTLLEHGLRCGEMDPACHVLQVFSLIDHVLPFTADEGQAGWLRDVIPNVVGQLKTFFRALDVDNRVHFAKRLANLDGGVLGVGEWLVLEELRYMGRMCGEVRRGASSSGGRFAEAQVAASLKFVCDLVSAANTSPWCLQYLATDPDGVAALEGCLTLLLDKYVWSEFFIGIALSMSAHWSASFSPPLGVTIVRILIRDQDVSLKNQELILDLAWNVLQNVDGPAVDANALRVDFSCWLAKIIQASPPIPGERTIELIALIMEWLVQANPSNTSKLKLDLSTEDFATLCECIKTTIPMDRCNSVEKTLAKVTVSGYENPISLSTISEHLRLTVQDVEGLLQDKMDVDIPSTPPRKPISHTQDPFGLVTVSPPTALLRSPAVTGLTKTYANNDFRQLRQTPSARQNTSRLPSMHVDVRIILGSLESNG